MKDDAIAMMPFLVQGGVKEDCPPVTFCNQSRSQLRGERALAATLAAS